MKQIHLLFYVFIMSLLFLNSCCKDDDVPNDQKKFDDQTFPIPTELNTDLNGDGVVDDEDKSEVLGGSVKVDYIKDGDDQKPLYGSGESGSEAIIGEKVEDGVRLCYQDVEKNCDEMGGLYSYETSVNMDINTLITGGTVIADQNEDDIVDWVDAVMTDSLSVLVESYKSSAVTQLEQVLTQIVNTPVVVDDEPVMIPDPVSGGTSVKQATYGDLLDKTKLNLNNVSNATIEAAVALAIEHAIEQVVQSGDETVDIQELDQAIQNNIVQALIDILIKEDEADKPIIKLTANGVALLPDGVTAQDIIAAAQEEVAISVATVVSEQVTDRVSAIVSEIILETIDIASVAQSESTGKPAQGLCPEGYHIPSDAEWMSLESAFGMKASDLARYGEEVTDRGADVDIVEKLKKELLFEYSGYASINGTFAEKGSVGAFWTSSAGVDELGEYVWVREISVHYKGIVRYKHREKSGLSIRCFKD